MNIDLNKNGLIDMLEQQIQHASTSTISNFATVAKKHLKLKTEQINVISTRLINVLSSNMEINR